MKIIKLNTPFEVSVVPRIMPTSMVDLEVFLRREYDEKTNTFFLPFTTHNGRINIILPLNADFSESSKHEITIKNATEIIYRGKLLVVNKLTETQNYTPSKQMIQRFK